MPTVKVTVLRNGEPVIAHRVVLEISGIGGGMSNAEYTDSFGVAEFNVEDGQEGDVFVDGSNEAHWGSYSNNDIAINL